MRRDRDAIAPFKTFAELDDTPIEYRIPGMLTMQGNVLISAYRKMGKTSLILDLAIALTSSRNFLGRLECRQLDGPLVYINLELMEPMLHQYCDDLGIKPDNDMLLFQDYRGRSSDFKLADEDWQDRFADRLYKVGARGLIIDPIHPLLVNSDVDSNNNDESRSAVEALGEIAYMAELDHLFIVDHTGHMDKSRARGASGKEDWADILWNLNTDDQTGAYRTLNVAGRGVAGSSQRYLMMNKQLMVASGTDGQQHDVAKQEGKPTPAARIKAYLVQEDKPLTQEQIASACGISQATVSRVLNDAPGLFKPIEKDKKTKLWEVVGKY